MSWRGGPQWVVALAAVGALAVSIYNSQQIGSVHVLINSRMTELLDLTQKASKAEGVKEQKDRDQIPH